MRPHLPSTATLRLCALAFALGVVACKKIPEGRSAIDAVSVTGAHEVDEADVMDRLATTASPKFAGLFRGFIWDYEVLDRAVLQRDLARAERFYRSRGYYDVKVRAGRVIATKADHVRVEIVVEEGAPVRNRGLSIGGIGGLGVDVSAAVAAAIRKKLPPGEPFDEDAFKAAQTEAKKALTDRGYAYAKVDEDVFLDVVQHVADATFTITPGTVARFGAITIVGLDPDGEQGPRPQEIPEAPLYRAINIKEGDVYSTAAIASATQALLDLNVFSAVEIKPYLPDPPVPVVTLTVRTEPTRLRQWRVGGGAEFDELKTDLHLLVGWENHNFLGGLRDFSVDFKPGLVLYPTRVNNIVRPTNVLPEERLRLQLTQPGFLEARTHGFIRPEVNVFPLLVETNPAPSDPVVGFVEGKTAIGVDRTFWKLFASLSYNFQVEDPFPYVHPLAPYLVNNVLVLSYPDLLVRFDMRDDPVKPHKGFVVSNDLQVAGLGGKRDIKIQPEVRTYVPIARRLTFATRGTLGWLLETNYGAYVQGNPADPSVIENISRNTVSDIEAMYFRGFFSGGPSQNRGFPIRGIAPYGFVPFLNPQTAGAAVGQGCAPSQLQTEYQQMTSSTSTPAQVASATSALQQCLLPIGGFTLWELSNELRIAVSGPFSTAVFCDMSDVAPKPGEFRFNYLHLSCGVGARYDTPVGPIRLDIAYRVPPLQVIGYKNEQAAADAVHTAYPPQIFGQPFGISFGIGEAY